MNTANLIDCLVYVMKREAKSFPAMTNFTESSYEIKYRFRKRQTK